MEEMRTRERPGSLKKGNFALYILFVKLYIFTFITYSKHSSGFLSVRVAIIRRG